MPAPTKLPQPWRSLADKLGGVQALADALGTSPRTIRKWAHQERSPGKTAQIAIDDVFKRNHIKPPEVTP
jgi:hypothetical protein